MKKPFVSILVLFFVILIAHVAHAQTAVINAGIQGSTDFFNNKEDTPFGYCYDGDLVEVLNAQDEWSMIRIGDGLLSIEGYVRSKDLDTSTDAVTSNHKIRVGEIKCYTDSKVPYYESPSVNTAVLGFLPIQAKVRVYGKYGEYYHVAVANHQCFISSYNILLYEDAVFPDIYGGVPEIGYLCLDKQHDEPSVLKAYPADNAMTIEHPWLPANQMGASSYPVELIADLGEWYQVRVMDEFGCGFMKRSCFSNEILLKDLFVNDTLALTSGEYQVGKDLSPGLYTFTLGKDENGTISISGSHSAYDRSIQANGPSFYTLYIPRNSFIRLENGGTLAPMRQVPILTEDSGFQYTGSGMFYVHSQFPKFNFNQTGVTYEFTVADQSRNGVVILYDLLGDEVSRRILAPGEKYETNQIVLYDSSFVEIQNCVLTIYYTHNG